MQTTQTTRSALTFRVLPTEEWPRLLVAGVEPFATYGLPAFPSHWRMVVAENLLGEIVGLSGLYETVHNDPWWIAERYRHHPHLITGLWQTTKQVLDQIGVGMVHATVSDSQPDVQSMVERLGYLPAPGKLYLLQTADCLLNEPATVKE